MVLRIIQFNLKVIAFALLSIMLTVAQPSMANNFCHSLFATVSKTSELSHLNSLSSEVWNRWISASPGQTPNQTYQKNAHIALTTVFEPWFLGKSDYNFQTMIREMHRISSVGVDGSSSF